MTKIFIQVSLLQNMISNQCVIQNKNISINGSFEVVIYEDGFDYMIAECPKLENMGWGETQEEAIEVLKQRNFLLFEELWEKNELIATLSKLNWEIIENNLGVMIISPFIIKTNNIEINKSYSNKSKQS